MVAAENGFTAPQSILVPVPPYPFELVYPEKHVHKPVFRLQVMEKNIVCLLLFQNICIKTKPTDGLPRQFKEKEKRWVRGLGKGAGKGGVGKGAAVVL